MDTRFCLHPTVTKRGFYFPCGQCPVCRMKARKQMAVRMYMEFSINKPVYSYFITLTYNDGNIPTCSGRPCFSAEHITTFLDLCKHKLSRLGYTQRYFLTCEYGEEGYRPHYHYIVFLYPRSGYAVGKLFRYQYLHEVVETSWNRGFCYQGTVSLASIMYCTAYALKDDESLERDWTGFEPGKPFRRFSNRPGLGLTDECVNWWTEYCYNDGNPRSGVSIHLPKRSVSTGIPVGVKRRIKDYYPDEYEVIKTFNRSAYWESRAGLVENATKYGSTVYIEGVRHTEGQDHSPDESIINFRKAIREFNKRQRKPLK